MFETYSTAILDNCFFEGNEAADNGGAMLAKIRSTVTINNSIFKLNQAYNRGGSIMIQQSKASIRSCSFVESTVSGYGGSIFAENIANLTVHGSSFFNCTASCGGSIAIQLESILNMQDSNINNSFANMGGGIYVDQNSLVIGNNLTVFGGQSIAGSGIYLHSSSGLKLVKFNFLRNYVNETGGAIYCKQSQIIMEEGTVVDSFAEINGGGVFGDVCQITLDRVELLNNSASINGGGIYFEKSRVEVHNTRGINNSAGKMGNFGVVTMNSNFLSNYLHLFETERNCIVFNHSYAGMKHTYLSNREIYCPIVGIEGSDVLINSVYFTEENHKMKEQDDSKISGNIVCTDESSKTEKIAYGKSFYIPFPE